MARTIDFPRVLWLVTSTWLVGCGRVGFGVLQDDPTQPLADGPVVIPDSAPPPIDAPPPPVDAAPPIDTAPLIDSSIPAGTPDIAFNIPTITTTCGAGATTVNALISNPGTADLVINNITLLDGDAFQLTGTFPMQIAPGGSADLKITALAAIIGTDRGGLVKTDKLVIDANVTANPVPISTTIMGANIDVTVPAPPPPQLSFSDASGNCPVQKPATIKNTGNLAATVQVQIGGPFAMTGTSSASVAIGGVMTRQFRPVTGLECSGVGTIQYQVTGATCSSGQTGGTVSATFNITGTSSCFCS